ncbi:hypothetical protein VKT23_001839 [Stygiomarasmius scandens]|uniref:Uncharacterized protein n=1 Tax=Marasmiellus scandens TaxID=2682957 RepID=A0ABR1K059_9AGAR
MRKLSTECVDPRAQSFRGIVGTESSAKVNEGAPMEIDDDDRNKQVESQKVDAQAQRHSGNFDPKQLDDFKKDLLTVLKTDFHFKGSLASGIAFPSASNPTLSIEGVGGISLPFTEQHARLIIDNVQSEDVVDQNTFHIDASKLHFRNPAFENWLNTEVLTKVTLELGVQVEDIKFELYKLLLHKKGSQFHKQEKANSPRVFASALIILPSEHTGGEFAVTHEDSSKTFDFSSDSLVSTTVMAWYIGTNFYEVNPIASGYRLALLFNLVRNTSESSLDLPGLPNAERGVEIVRAILTKWQKERSRYKGAKDTIVYPLVHRYPKTDLERGAQCLKGQDADLVRHIRGVAEELGFVIALADVKLRELRCRSDDYWDDCCFDESYETDDDDLVIEESELTISQLYDLDGTDLVGMDIQKDSLIPENYFADKGPNDRDYGEDYDFRDGDYAQINLLYYTSALVLIHGKEPKFAPVHKTRQVLAKLTKSATANPSAADREQAHTASKNLNQTGKAQIHQALHLACLWKDAKLMETALACVELASAELPPMLEVWQAFGWKAFSTEVEKALSRISDISTVRLLNNLPDHASLEEKPFVLGWLQRIVESYILSWKAPNTAEFSFLLAAIKQHGVEWFTEKIFPYLAKVNDDQGNRVYLFWKSFVGKFLESNTTPTTLVKCLQVLVKVWDTTPSGGMEQLHSERVANIVEISELAVRAGCPEVCTMLFEQVFAKHSPAEGTFYEKLVPRIAQNKNLDVTKLEPFKGFVHKAIIEYLQKVLGPRPNGVNALLPKPVWCDCNKVCARVNALLEKNNGIAEHQLGKRQRGHIREKLAAAAARGVLSYTESQNHTMTITTTELMRKRMQWDSLVERAQGFLKSIGDERVKGVMENRYRDVQLALEGSKPMQQGSTSVASSSQSRPMQTAASQAGTRNQGGTAAGNKRKRSPEPEAGEVIELTYD